MMHFLEGVRSVFYWKDAAMAFVLGFALAHAGLPITTWQFWFILGIAIAWRALSAYDLADAPQEEHHDEPIAQAFTPMDYVDYNALHRERLEYMRAFWSVVRSVGGKVHISKFALIEAGGPHAILYREDDIDGFTFIAGLRQ